MRTAEMLRILKLSRGRAKFVNNRLIQAELIARNVFDAEKYIEIRSKCGMPPVPCLSRQGHYLVHEALTIAMDFGMIIKTPFRGVYQLTPYGDWSVTQWFDIRSHF